VLAARIDASGARGYTLETVPAEASVPRGAKAIGTCEAGKSKILYRRWGATHPSSGEAGETGPASAAQAIVMPQGQARRSPVVQGDRALRPVPASAPSLTAQPIARSDAAASAAASGQELEKSRGAGASEVVSARAIDGAAALPAQLPTDRAVVAKVPLARQASAFMAESWHWMLALVLLPVAGWIWFWHARRSGYDEAGLPRGPKL
jgi:hypothetical protein